GLESLANSLITPPNSGGGGGNCFPSMVMVAPGEPGAPVISWADASAANARPRENAAVVAMCHKVDGRLDVMVPLFIGHVVCSPRQHRPGQVTAPKSPGRPPWRLSHTTAW